MKETKFKQTEVGLIPNDWEVKKLGELGKFRNGVSKPADDFGYGYPFINLLDIFGKTKIDHTTELGLINSTKLEQSTYSLQTGDVLFVRSSVKPEGVGLTTVIKKDLNKTIYSGFILRFREDNDVLTTNFKEFVFYNENFRKKLISSSTVSANTNINQPALKELYLAYPISKQEQDSIARVLSDVDAVISTTEKLIAKKKALKQGAMQTLLSGKMRIQNGKWIKTTHFKQTELGPIPQEWEVKNINKTCTIKARIGWQGLKSNEYLESGDYLLVTGTDFENGFINWKTCSYVSEWRFKQDKNIQIKKGDVLITKDGTIGKVAFLNEIPQEGTLNSGVFVVRPKNSDEINSIFLSLVFKSFWFDDFLEQITSGSTIVHLYQKDFTKFNFPLPSKPEQIAIATVLSDMDSEIAALETKLAKYRQLKTGMMQQLLTGKVRLVDSAEIASENQSKHSVPLSFKRSVLAAEIADRLCNEPTFGHVKMEKMLFLTEKMCNIDIDSSYHRDAAGPFDNRGLHSVDSQLAKQKWFKAVKQDKGYRYAPLEKRGGHKQYFERYFSDRLSTFDNIINVFKSANTEQCEIVATLYSAWEDFLKQGISPTEEQIVTEVLTNWHKSKERIPKERWLKALLWMKEHEFIPEVGEKIK